MQDLSSPLPDAADPWPSRVSCSWLPLRQSAQLSAWRLREAAPLIDQGSRTAPRGGRSPARSPDGFPKAEQRLLAARKASGRRLACGQLGALVIAPQDERGSPMRACARSGQAGGSRGLGRRRVCAREECRGCPKITRKETTRVIRLPSACPLLTCVQRGFPLLPGAGFWDLTEGGWRAKCQRCLRGKLAVFKIYNADHQPSS